MEVFGQFQEDIDDILSKGIIFYKFSKSNESFTNMFYEHFYSAYPENSIIKAQNSHGLSFCADMQKLLGCAMYGDQITQIIIDKNSPYFNEILKTLRKEHEEYGRFGEYNSFIVQTGNNYSLSDPSVLNELIQVANDDSIDTFFHYTDFNKKKMEDIYDDLGFHETANFIRQIREAYIEQNECHLFFTSCKEDFDKIRTLANSFIKSKSFNFEKAIQDYLDNPIPKDRRREPQPIINEKLDIYDRKSSAAHYLYVNNFTEEQAKQIMKILDNQNLFESVENLNTILPLFTNDLNDANLRTIKKLTTQHDFKVEELSDIIEDFVDSSHEIRRNILSNTQMSLPELIADKIKDYYKERNGLISNYTKTAIDRNYR